MRGYFEIGIYGGKTSENVGTLWRSAYQLGAAGIFTICGRYKKQPTDTFRASRHIPLRQFDSVCAFLDSIPQNCEVIAVEMGGKPLSEFKHPERAIYLLGAEDTGIPEDLIKECNGHISLESVRSESYNVSTAGALVMYNRQFGVVSV